MYRHITLWPAILESRMDSVMNPSIFSCMFIITCTSRVLIVWLTLNLPPHIHTHTPDILFNDLQRGPTRMGLPQDRHLVLWHHVGQVLCGVTWTTFTARGEWMRIKGTESAWFCIYVCTLWTSVQCFRMMSSQQLQHHLAYVYVNICIHSCVL